MMKEKFFIVILGLQGHKRMGKTCAPKMLCFLRHPIMYSSSLVQDDDMTSDDEWTTTPATIKTINNSIPSSGTTTTTPSSPRRLFNLKLVNSYGNANMEPLVSEASDTIRLGGGGASSAAKSYIALDWHPRARPLFYNDKAAEEVSQDDASFHPGKATTATATAVKKQTLGLTECLKLYTSQVQ